MLKKIDGYDGVREPNSRFGDQLLHPKQLQIEILKRIKSRLQAADIAFENNKILTDLEQHLFTEIFSIETDIDLLRMILENPELSDMLDHPVQGDGKMAY